MANPLKTFLKAIFGKNLGNVSKEEIKKAEMAGELAAGKAEERLRLGFVPQAKVDAEAARQSVEGKKSKKVNNEKTHEGK